MADSFPDADPAGGGAARPGYGLPNQAAPLPRQWQMQQLRTPPARGNRSVQHFVPGAPDAGDWRPATATARTERAILIGLWLLVMLTAIAIGLRLLDLSAVSPGAAEPPVRPDAAADVASAARAAAYAAVRAHEDDPFDDPPPAVLATPGPTALPPSVPAAAPAATPAATPRPGVGLALASTLSVQRPVPAAPVPAAPALPAGAAAACPEALRAMQLCTEQRR